MPQMVPDANDPWTSTCPTSCKTHLEVAHALILVLVTLSQCATSLSQGITNTVCYSADESQKLRTMLLNLLSAGQRYTIIHYIVEWNLIILFYILNQCPRELWLVATYTVPHCVTLWTCTVSAHLIRVVLSLL